MNFRMLGDEVVFRTAALSSVRSATHAGRVGFEVITSTTPCARAGSVLVTGYAHEVHDVEQLQRLERLGVEPWSGDDRPFYVRIEPVEVSGDASAPVDPKERIGNEQHSDAGGVIADRPPLPLPSAPCAH